MKVDDEQFPPPVINMVEAYFQTEEARQRRALWPEVRSSGAEKGIGRINGPHPVLFSIDWGTTVGILGRGLFDAELAN
ncbi:hypothetical protein L3X38_015330 [Prunus dulcis]|uniref:Uncharacterized protein n=1 Tax=Prunus dulcis TaxID=3755 RepID=A0AAD4ZJ55_PRUDU|nr:hypothetical protein L3X38_015330 [Prunus dulcis]